ncbi:MAG: dicarboxylate/amino acid:cation symporter [Bacteroidota bacterium]
MKKLKLHTQILIALILGAAFGAFFHVDQSVLVVATTVGTETAKHEVSGWSTLEIQTGDSKQIFTSREGAQVLRAWKGLPKDKRPTTVLTFQSEGKEPQQFTGVTELRKEKTIATMIRPIGTIFIRLLNLIAIPLVLASLLVGAASLGDIKKVARIGAKTLVYFMTTTALAISIGLVLANVIQPGKQVSESSKELLMAEYQSDVQSKIATELDINIVDMFVEMIPTNPFRALANSEMLQIVFFAVLMGVVLTFVKEEKSGPVIRFFDGLADTMIEMVHLVMKIAPYAVFALIAATVSEFGFEIIQTLIWYVACVLLGLVIQTTVVYPLLVKAFSSMSPLTFLRQLKPVQLVAFSTSSSAATLPVNMETCETKLGVPNSITSFVLPLGATINMDGTALYQGVAAVFIAQVYGFDLSLAEQLTIVLTATLASIGTAPVPGVGIIMLIIVLKAIHVPEEGIALIMGVDRFLDMARTVTNVTGDAGGAVIMASVESHSLRQNA